MTAFDRFVVSRIPWLSLRCGVVAGLAPATLDRSPQVTCQGLAENLSRVAGIVRTSRVTNPDGTLQEYLRGPQTVAAQYSRTAATREFKRAGYAPLTPQTPRPAAGGKDAMRRSRPAR